MNFFDSIKDPKQFIDHVKKLVLAEVLEALAGFEDLHPTRADIMREKAASIRKEVKE